MMIPRYETERYTVVEENGRLLGHEKPAETLTADRQVLAQPIGVSSVDAVLDALNKIGAASIIQPGSAVAIKINLGGGINHVPTTYSDPAICEAIIQAVKRMGAHPFVCESDMRAHKMDARLLRVRGYLDMLARNDAPFVNLSQGETVQMTCRDVDIPLPLPEILLRPETRIISFAPPKHHWECGITGSQKNMYGAIAEPRKSLYHRQFDRIDRVVAAASRIMRPDISILAAFHLGAGLGPHFCYPVAFNRMLVAKDMIRCDKAASEILGFPFDRVQYAMINANGYEVAYDLHPDSDWPDARTLQLIKAHSVNPRSAAFWKRLLYLQYFVPHRFQSSVYPSLEFIATWVNHAFYGSRVLNAHHSDSPPS